MSLYFSSMSPVPELNIGNIALAETTSEAYDENVWTRQLSNIN